MRKAGTSPSRAPLALVRRARKINRRLAEAYPDAVIELDFRNHFELLVAVVMSAQTTDVRVNSVTPTLFAHYPDAAALAAASPREVEEIIRPVGFYRAKTRAIIGLAQGLLERFDGVVPRTVRDLTTLPGVGRKTANVVVGNAFSTPAITVDTHVGRLARRFGWTEQKDPDKVETDIAALIERREWTKVSHRLIFHGRRVCFAQRPACGACPVADLCPSFGAGIIDPAAAEAAIARRASSQLVRQPDEH